MGHILRPHRLLGLPASILMFFASGGSAAAQVRWFFSQPTHAPSGRTHHGAGDDPMGVFLFGGREVTTGLDLADTWVCSSGVWRPIGSSWLPTPPARRWHALSSVCRRSCNGDSDDFVMFGGQQGDRPNHALLGDTWVFGTRTSGTVPITGWWPALPGGPSPRRGHAMGSFRGGGYDVVLFGGETATGASFETWAWDSSTWSWHQLRSSTVPPARTEHGMAFDARRGRIVVFGGRAGTGSALGDTWEWDGIDWTLVATTGPAPRWDASLAYDAARNRVVLLGGVASIGGVPLTDGVWEWDGSAWQRRLMSSRDFPAPRIGAARSMAFDYEADRLLLFGGRFPGAPVGWTETWHYGTTQPANYRGQATAGSCGGPRLRERVHAHTFGHSRPWVGDDFEVACEHRSGQPSGAILITGFSDQVWGSTRLPLDLAFLGRPGCLLRTGVALALTESGPGPWSWSVPIPALPSLVGATFYQQALVFDRVALAGFDLSGVNVGRFGAR